MGNQLEKKYGLFTAIAMVVGIVIGSGVFFKAEKILKATGGNLPLGILAWIIGGLIMIVCSYVFSVMATKYEYVNGVVDYADVTMGKKYGFYVGWFMATIYYPTLTAVLAWVSARYICVILGFDIIGGACFAITCFLLIASYAVNTLSPRIAGKFQVATTVIKLIPLFLMAIVGTIVGLVNGMTFENFTSVVNTEIKTGTALLTAVVATAFAYEGWIIATSINAELKNAKKALPLALTFGSGVVMLTYILYYIGLAGGVPNAVMMESGEQGAMVAFQNVFGNMGATLLFVFVVISCVGTLNGLMLGCTRGIYAIAARDAGPNPEIFKEIDAKTNMPTNSAVLGLLLCGFWLVYFYGANLTSPVWFGKFSFDSSELPIVSIYGFYIPIFIMIMKKETDWSIINRFIAPALALVSCVFMIYAAFVAHKMAVVYYLIVFIVIMLIGKFFNNKNN